MLLSQPRSRRVWHQHGLACPWTMALYDMAKVYPKCSNRHSHLQWQKFLRSLAGQHLAIAYIALQLCQVCDTDGTGITNVSPMRSHCTPLLYRTSITSARSGAPRPLSRAYLRSNSFIGSFAHTTSALNRPINVLRGSLECERHAYDPGTERHQNLHRLPCILLHHRRQCRLSIYVEALQRKIEWAMAEKESQTSILSGFSSILSPDFFDNNFPTAVTSRLCNDRLIAKP